jgi:hypothetical protein
VRRISGHYGSGGVFQARGERADRVPVGIEFLAPPSSEPQLLQITCGFVSSRSMPSLRRNIALLTLDLMARRARIYICAEYQGNEGILRAADRTAYRAF